MKNKINDKLHIFNFDKHIDPFINRDIAVELNEGLITTYNISSCRNYLMKKYPFILHVTGFIPNRLGNNSAKIHNKLSDTTLNDMFFINISYKDYKYINKIIGTCNNLFGWFISRISVIYYPNNGIENEEIFWHRDNEFISDNNINLDDFIKTNKIREFYLFFEAKYSIETPFVDDVILYHATNRNNIKKIIKYGLIPKNLDDHPDRIYFSTDLKHIKLMFLGRIDFHNLVYLRLKQNKNSLYKFYNDGRTIKSVFTLDCINPKYIQILLNNKWIDILDLTDEQINKIINN